MAWLYTGADPVQTGVDPATILLDRAALLSGRVLDAAGAPLASVTVIVAEHPEYGETVTRADGRFDLVVNGGTGLGMMWGREKALEMLREAGFDHVRVDEIPDDPFNLHFLCIK